MERTLRYDHYKVLGVPRDADTRSIKRAYRERVKQWHPDRNESSQAAEVFHALHEAYATLSDAESRADYDERLRFYREAGHAIPPQRTSFYTRHPRMPVEDPRPAKGSDRLAFKGLHLTGLLFGILLVLGICTGCAFLGWPVYTLFFILPGLAIIPDSIAGLRMR
ncbi:MAG: J domain-containing protein [Flavobacteriales bacterium]|nr:J domain-containing protein [Flavobacteriales bacterium]